MVIQIILLVTILVSFFPLESRSEGDCMIQSSQDILRCALKRHPDILNRELGKDRDSLLVKVAGRRVNPELNGKIITSDHGQILNTETTLLHTLEYNGKRQSRIFQAQAQQKLSVASLLEIKELIALQTVLTAHRLSQIVAEKNLIHENGKTYDRILKHYQTRRLLSPQEQVEMSVFESGKQQLVFKEVTLLNEETVLINFLETATGVTYKKIKSYLPLSRKNWPRLTSTISQNQPAVLKEAMAELEMTKANLKLAKSEAWPDLKIGPTIETEKFNGNDSVLIGGSIQIPLPLLSQNRGAKMYAQLDEKRAQFNVEAVEKKVVRLRENLLQHYQKSLNALGLFNHTMNTQKAHQNTEDLFERGLLSISMMIESHRQHLELIEMKHSHELASLEALWKIMIIDGQMMEAKL